MKKSQLRANLLDDSAVFVNPKQKAPSKSYPQQTQQQQQQQQSYRPQAQPNMQYVTHPLAQYPRNDYEPNGQYCQPQQPMPHPPRQERSHSQPYNSGPYNQQPPQNYGRFQQPPQHEYGQQRSHNSYPTNGYSNYDQHNQQQPQFMDKQRNSYNDMYSHKQNNYQQDYNPNNYTYQQNQPIPQQRSHSHSFQQLASGQQHASAPQQRKKSASQSFANLPEAEPQPRTPYRAQDQIFSIGGSDDDDDDDNNEIYNQAGKSQTMFSTEDDDREQDKIQQLEEKIQRLERVLALQELETKIKNTSRPDTETKPEPMVEGSSQAQMRSQKKDQEHELELERKEKHKQKEKQKQRQKQEQQSDAWSPANQTQHQASQEKNGSRSDSPPPLPPPPPPEKKSMMNSPKANLFLSEIEPVSRENDLRLSTSSLIPTDKSISDQSLDDLDNDADVSTDFNDEPPPSYEELEKSGTLTYSQSIYRTGFEKAGYQMNHVDVPFSPINKKSELQLQSKLNDLNNKLNSTSKKSDNLMSKRKIPSQITDDMFEKAALKNSITSISDFQPPNIPPKPNQSLINKKNNTPQSTSQIPPPIPAAKPVESNQIKPPARIVSQQKVGTANSDTFGTLSNELKPNSTLDSLYTNNKNENSNVIKYFTSSSFEKLPNGVIQPILPSKCKEPTEVTITKFKRTREMALTDYKQFTPKIQFYWAILLLETLSKSDVISKMTIDGKPRKAELSYKKLRKQRLLFLTTAIKVLEKLIQVAPNDTRARLYLGDIYSGGIHPGLIERDEKHGYELFYDASVKQNDPVACYRIACCLEAGVGCNKDIPKSILFFERGAALGDPSSMCQLGMMHFAGVNGCVQDIPLSISYHKQAYETLRSKTVMASDPLISSRSFQDARGALYTLAKLHQTDKQILCLTDLNDSKVIKTIDELKYANVWCNKSKSLKYYLEAAKLGHNESQACLGYYHSQGFFPTHLFKSDKESNNNVADTVDARKSIYWFSKAAADGHTYASLGLARWYGSGGVDNDGKVILKRDEQQAFLWGRKAADAGELIEAEYMIGVCYEQGFGVEKNLVMAANYYERSARKGYKKAISKLKALKRS